MIMIGFNTDPVWDIPTGSPTGLRFPQLPGFQNNADLILTCWIFKQTTTDPNRLMQTIWDSTVLDCLFGVLRRFQHCTGHITTGSWKGRGNQYI